MVERGILFDEAVGEFEKRFIKLRSGPRHGKPVPRGPKFWHSPQYLGRKIDEYKLDSNGHRRYSR